MEKITSLKDILEGIEFKLPKMKRANLEYTAVSLNDSGHWNQVQRKVIEIIERYRPKTLLDIGCNTGRYAKAAAGKGYTVVAFDINEYYIHSLYREALGNNYNILPLLMDFNNPMPATGTYKEYPPATERLKCEMVLCLATVHHLVFKQGLRFQEIARALAAFSEKLLLVEFIPREDHYVSQWYNSCFEWYHSGEFINALEKHFCAIETIASYPSPRIILLCKKY